MAQRRKETKSNLRQHTCFQSTSMIWETSVTSAYQKTTKALIWRSQLKSKPRWARSRRKHSGRWGRRRDSMKRENCCPTKSWEERFYCLIRNMVERLRRRLPSDNAKGRRETSMSMTSRGSWLVGWGRMWAIWRRMYWNWSTKTALKWGSLRHLGISRSYQLTQNMRFSSSSCNLRRKQLQTRTLRQLTPIRFTR